MDKPNSFALNTNEILNTKKSRQRMKKIAAHGWGVAAEELVAEHYRTESCGTILERRLKTPVGEIDLIVLTEESLVFIEVKARKDLSEICNVITDTQWKRIEQAALWYLSQKFESIDLNIRFDAAFVSPGKDILFFHNAWMSQC